MSTKDLGRFLSSLPGEKHVAVESVGFIHPIYANLSSIEGCTVSVANPSKLRLISGSGTKNDRNDAKVLGDLLRTNYLPLAHMRDEETRKKLFVVNDRVAYRLRRGELRGTMVWLLKRRGIEVERSFSNEGEEEAEGKPKEVKLTQSPNLELSLAKGGSSDNSVRFRREESPLLVAWKVIEGTRPSCVTN
jgi:hypothetical protein